MMKQKYEASPNTGSSGRGGRNPGELCNNCDTTFLYLTSILDNNDDDCHLIPLQIKVAEEDIEVDVVAELDNPESSANNNTLHRKFKSSQGLQRHYPVNILLDTGSLGPDGNYINADIVNNIDPLKLNIKRSTNEVCSGMDGSCVSNNSYLFVTVMITKCYILTTTPFDLIIGRKTIKKHHLVNRFPTYFGFETIDITHETDCTPPVLCQVTKQQKVQAKTNHKATCCATTSGSCSTGKVVAKGLKIPESSKTLQALNLKRPIKPVGKIPHTLATVQQIFRSHDGDSAEKIYLMGGRVCTALERMHLSPGLTREELLGHATTDDEEDDEAGALIDTFRHFTEINSGNYLDSLTYGKDIELNKSIRSLCEEYPEIFSSTLQKIPAKLSPFRTEVDLNKWEADKTKVKNDEILKQISTLLKLSIIERSDAGNITPSAS
jgi:hypothetical protein